MQKPDHEHCFNHRRSINHGAAAPMVLEMSIAPVVAQKRAQNFGIAETAAVVFAATYEGTLDIPENTEICTPAAREGTENAYSVTCTHGTGKYVQSVTALFALPFPTRLLMALMAMLKAVSLPLKLLRAFQDINVHKRVLGAFTATTTNTMKH